MHPRASTRGAISWSLFQGGRDPYVILVIIYIFTPYLSAVLVGDPVRGQELIARYHQYAGLDPDADRAADRRVASTGSGRASRASH